jgi:hypothetical protein
VITVAGAEKVSALSSHSPAVAASSGMVMIELSGSLAQDAKTGVDGRCRKALGRLSDMDGNESTERREACCLDDAVFSRTPNWVGRVFMLLRGLRESLSLDLFRILAVGVLA